MRAERYTVRDRSYGAWHRFASIQRYLAPEQACSMTMADLDSVMFTEYNHASKLPLCLVEVAIDVGQDKPTGVISALAQQADIPAYVALYSHASEYNPADTNWPDIAGFRIKRVWPRPERRWRHLTPNEWAAALVQIRSWQLRKYLRQDAANDRFYNPHQE
jgi:hypothetical protein